MNKSIFSCDVYNNDPKFEVKWGFYNVPILHYELVHLSRVKH